MPVTLNGSILESELSIWAEQNGYRSIGQAGFRKGFTTLDNIFTLRALIEEGKAHNKRIYCCFVDFRKAFDIVPRARLMQRLEALGVSTDMQWGIYALFQGLSEVVASTIRVKQGCPLSPTLFGLYIDEVSHYIERFGSMPSRYSYTNIAICL